MSSFEKYLKENRNKLKVDEVNPEIWLSIENEMLKKGNRRKSFYLRIVSAAAAILFLGLIGVNWMYNQPQDDLESALAAQMNIDETDFIQRIDHKIMDLSAAKIPAKRKTDFDLLLQQLSFLDSQYQDCMKYIETNGYQEFIGDQILDYYHRKIELLDKIKFEIEKLNHYENNYDAESQTVKLIF